MVKGISKNKEHEKKKEAFSLLLIQLKTTEQRMIIQLLNPDVKLISSSLKIDSPA